jgi:beta-RFAP synthase
MGLAAPIQIETAARLHFGLLDTAPPFGGLGMMVDRPQTVLRFEPAERLIFDETLRSRGLPIAERLREYLQLDAFPGVRVRTLQSAPAHCGYGSGTQLSLAIAEGLCRACRVEITPDVLAARIADRGKRSAVGIHGYFVGGLIFEQPARNQASHSAASINPVASRVPVPPQWRVVLARPRNAIPAVSGDREAHEFSKLQPNCECRRRLTKLIEHDILPAVRGGDFYGFASALSQYNHDSGLLFAAVQGGPYNGREVTDLIEQLRSVGGVGVGQSSWGPGVFAWCESDAQAAELADKLDRNAVLARIVRPVHTGRRIELVD